MTTRDSYLELALDEDQRMVLDMVEELSTEVLAPAAEEVDREAALPAELRGALAESGLYGLTAPEELGGVGFDLRCFALVLEEVARAERSSALDLLLSGDLVIQAIAADGSGEEARSQAGRIAAGELRAAFAHQEISGGADHRHLETRATVRGDEIVLEGRKLHALGAPDADELLVSAVEGEGVSLFLVPTATAGVVRGDRERRLGFRGIAVGEVRFEGAVIPASRRCGAAGAGAEVLGRLLARARVGVAAIAAGLARAARDDAARYADERRQFGRRIGDFEALRERLARIDAARATAMALALSAAGVADAGRDARQAAEIAQYAASEGAMEAADHALQIYGGYGYSEEYPVERHYRDARWLAVAFGGRDQIALDIAGRLLP